jgi:ligand-binding SRPBCC domain-containing protein
MNVRISTQVPGDFRQVMARFDRELFEALAPPNLEIVRFDGSRSGDRVHIRLHFPGFALEWVSRIVEAAETESEAWFVDEGEKLPFFLTSWRHVHRVAAAGPGQSRIEDDITFSSPRWLPAWLVWPTLYLQFAARGPLYRRFFSKAETIS